MLRDLLPFGLSLWAFAGASFMVGLGAWLHGSVGFGAALAAAPVLMLIEPALVPGPVIVSGVFLTLIMAHRHRLNWDVTNIRWALLGNLGGAIAGAWALTLLPARGLGLLFGFLVIFAVGLSLAVRVPARTPGRLTAAGVLAGFMGVTTSMGGPPIALMYQNASGEALRGALAFYFTVGAVIAMGGLRLAGRLGSEEILMGLLLVPAIIIGYRLSARTAAWLDLGRTRAAVLTLAAGAGFLVIGRYLN